MNEPPQPGNKLPEQKSDVPPPAVIPAAGTPAEKTPAPQANGHTAAPAAAAAEEGSTHLTEPRRLQLFDLYKNFRYNDLAFSELSRGAVGLESKVRWSVLVTLGIALLVDVIPGMNAVTLRWIWGVLNVLATLLTIYAMSAQSSERQFRWFDLAKRARAWASKLETFTVLMKEQKVDGEAMNGTVKAFRQELQSEFSDAGPVYLEFEAKHRTRLTDALMTTLKAENKTS